MIVIENARTVDGTTRTIKISADKDQQINGKDLLVMPGLIDPHVHFRTPGSEHKENWMSAARAAIYGGYTSVFDMPNTIPSTTTYERLMSKKALIDSQLQEVGIPLNYQLYFGVDRNHFEQIPQVASHICALKIFMGSSTGDLLVDDDSSLHAAFSIAAKFNLMVAVHAEDECTIRHNTQLHAHEHDFALHSKIRSAEAARIAVSRAISLAKLYSVKLYVLHVGSKDECELIAKAKREGLNVFAETTPHHLFLNESYYPKLQARAQVNPPLRTPEDQAALWEAIRSGVIDIVASDHAPHTLAEKSLPYGQAPSGMPGIETTLPLLLTAYHDGKISLPLIQQLLHDNCQKIFPHPQSDNNLVLIDLNKEQTIEDTKLKTRCAWSPYSGRKLKGFPVITIVNGQVFKLHL